VVEAQSAQYDEIGRTIDELEEDAKKYEQQAQEMNSMADASEKRAENIETVNAPAATAANTAPVSAENLRPNGHVADDPPAKLAKNALARKQEPGSFGPDPVSAPASSSNISTPATSAYPNKISANLATESPKSTGSFGTASASRSSLRENLRARFAEKNGRQPTAKELEVLSQAPEAQPTGAPSRSAEKDAAKKAGAELGSQEDTVASFNKGLGDPRLEIAGSETDASVQAMMRELGTTEPARSRGPASSQSSEIGSEDGPSLFERCHATHKRCQKNGCVSQSGETGKAGS
jgi:hypothetical protein